jgi:hypothetical protein
MATMHNFATRVNEATSGDGRTILGVVALAVNTQGTIHVRLRTCDIGSADSAKAKLFFLTQLGKRTLMKAEHNPSTPIVSSL